jgi:hypothetical protein
MSERRVENLFKTPALGWASCWKEPYSLKTYGRFKACFDQNTAICGHFFSPKKKKKEKTPFALIKQHFFFFLFFFSFFFCHGVKIRPKKKHSEKFHFANFYIKFQLVGFFKSSFPLYCMV